jgi:putative transposase
MRWKSHVRFGGRTGETHQAKAEQGAPVRPLHRAPHLGGQGVPRRRARCVLPAGYRLVARRPHASRAGGQRLADGHLAASARPGQTIAHADHGGQYTSWLFGARLREAGLLGSMGSVGDCYDSVVEAFFSSLQRELLDQHHWTSRAQLATAIFEWIEWWYKPPPPPQLLRRPQPHRLRDHPSGMITTTTPSVTAGYFQTSGASLPPLGWPDEAGGSRPPLRTPCGDRFTAAHAELADKITRHLVRHPSRTCAR